MARHNVPDLPYKYSSYHSCDYGDDAPCVCLETTHLSLIMPNKYQNFNDVHKHFNSHQDTSIYLYRNYYQAKIEKKFKGHKSISMNGTPYYSTGIRTKITWTKREKPEWLSI